MSERSPLAAFSFSSICSVALTCRYMRGRLDVARLNSAIDSWLTLLRDKYTLLSTKGGLHSRQMSEAQVRRFTQWSEEEVDESLRSSFFLSTDDLRDSAALQSLGAINLKAVLVGLRHLGRIKNWNGAGTPKYILVQ